MFNTNDQRDKQAGTESAAEAEAEVHAWAQAKQLANRGHWDNLPAGQPGYDKSWQASHRV